MNILAVILDWFIHFDKKIILLIDIISNFFDGIRLVFYNKATAATKAVGEFINMVKNNISAQGKALINFINKLIKSFIDSVNWFLKFNINLVTYGVKLFGWATVSAFNWFSQFLIALFMLSIEFLKDFANAFMESSLSAIPDAITTMIFSIPGFNLLPVVNDIKKGISKTLKELFKVGGSLNPNVDFTKAITGALNAAAKEVEKGFKKIFGI